MDFMAMNLDGRESRMPAALSPHLMLCVRGATSVKRSDGLLIRRPRLVLNGPCLLARHSFSEPGTLVISVMFKPGLLREALNISAGDILSSSVPFADIVGREKVDELLEAVDQSSGTAEYIRLFQDFLLLTLNLAPQKKSIAAALLAAHQRVFSPMIDFALHFGVGERQLERRMQLVFGVSLRDVRRIYRFGLTLQSLIGASVAWGDLTRVAQDAGYYDQAHMHREFVELGGLGPHELLVKIASDDPAYWVYRIAPADYKRLFIPVG